MAHPQSLNRYAYTRNDPVNLIDPLGLCTWSGQYLNSAGQVTGATICVVDGDSGSGTINGMFGGSDLMEIVHSTDGTDRGGGADTLQRNSYADCVRENGDFFSLQNIASSATGGRFGDGS